MVELDGDACVSGGGGVALAFALAFSLLVALPGAAEAQGFETTPSLFEARLLRTDVEALHANPAQLAWLGGAHASLQTAHRLRSSADRARLFRGGLGWGLDRGFGVALGGDASRFDPRASAVRLGLALGNERAAIGWSVAGWHGPAVRAARRSHTVGLSWRATPVVGLATVLEAINEPTVGALRMRRRWATAIALRSPREHIAIEVGVEHLRDDDTDAVVTIHARPVDGVRAMSTVHVDVADARLASWTGGVELSVGPTSVSGGAAGLSDGVDTLALAGVSWSLPAGPQLIQRRRALWRIDLTGGIAESPRARLLGTPPAVFTDLLEQLDRVRRDDALAGVYLNIGGISLGAAQLWELRQALDALQASGKVVVAYLQSASFRDLYVVGGADFVAASHNVAVLVTGIGGTRYYLGDLFDMLGVDARFVRIGEYKSGPERFTESGPTPAAREQADAVLDSAWALFERQLREDSELDEDAFDAFWTNAPLTAPELAETGFVDLVVSRHELQRRMQAALGRTFHIIGGPEPIEERPAYWFPPHPIAVIHIDGGIVSGTSGDQLIFGGRQVGARSVAQSVARVLADRRIRGAVIRINSPGGSAVASETILEELRRLSPAIPVAVSMGDVAASGGYYAAMQGGRVFATPLTLTGSIGIYAGTFGLDRLLQRVGISGDRSTRGGTADLFDGHRWTDDEAAQVQRYIEYAYDLFVERVTEARPLSVADVDLRGQGRVYLGEAAVEQQLVDELGGFLAALEHVRAEAGVPPDADIHLMHFPQPRWSIAQELPSLDIPIQEPAPGWQALLERLGVAGIADYLWTALEGADGRAMALLEWTLDSD